MRIFNLNILILLFVFSVIAPNCSNVEVSGNAGKNGQVVTINATQLADVTPQETTNVGFVAPEIAEQFSQWVSKRIPELCKQLNIRPPKSVRIYVDTTPIKVVDGSVYYLLGLYDRGGEEIRIWTRYWFNMGTMTSFEFSIQDLKNDFYHEFLHHYDHVMGNDDCPEDHNKLFEDRIKELGWQ